MWPICLPSPSSAASSGGGKRCRARSPCSPTCAIALLGSTTAPSPCPHRAAWLSQMPPAEPGTDGAGTICCQCGLGSPSRAWGMGCRHGAVTVPGSGEGGTACHLLQVAQRSQAQPTAGQVCTLWAQVASSVPKGPCVTLPSLYREQRGWRLLPDSPSCCWAARGSCGQPVSAAARGAAAFAAGPGGSHAFLQVVMPAVPHPCPRLSPHRWQVHKLLPRWLVLLQAQLLQVLHGFPELGRG